MPLVIVVEPTTREDAAEMVQLPPIEQVWPFTVVDAGQVRNPPVALTVSPRPVCTPDPSVMLEAQAVPVETGTPAGG